VNVLGLVFAGTRTGRADAMTRFTTDVLGLPSRTVAGSDAAFHDLPDGSVFAVQPVAAAAAVDAEERTVGFLVDDVRSAAQELHAAGVVTDEIAAAGGFAYTHFRAPDGRLYELVERLPVHPGQQPGQDRRTP
jgi:catechol 2,3-dioxygenase-like lactoylglutathione lyase family enzyme